MVQRIALIGSKVKTPFLGHLDAQVEDGDNVISFQLDLHINLFQ